MMKSPVCTCIVASSYVSVLQELTTKIVCREPKQKGWSVLSVWWGQYTLTPWLPRQFSGTLLSWADLRARVNENIPSLMGIGSHDHQARLLATALSRPYFKIMLYLIVQRWSILESSWLSKKYNLFLQSALLHSSWYWNVNEQIRKNLKANGDDKNTINDQYNKQNQKQKKSWTIKIMLARKRLMKHSAQL